MIVAKLITASWWSTIINHHIHGCLQTSPHQGKPPAVDVPGAQRLVGHKRLAKSRQGRILRIFQEVGTVLGIPINLGRLEHVRIDNNVCLGIQHCMIRPERLHRWTSKHPNLDDLNPLFLLIKKNLEFAPCHHCPSICRIVPGVMTFTTWQRVSPKEPTIGWWCY